MNSLELNSIKIGRIPDVAYSSVHELSHIVDFFPWRHVVFCLVFSLFLFMGFSAVVKCVFYAGRVMLLGTLHFGPTAQIAITVLLWCILQVLKNSMNKTGLNFEKLANLNWLKHQYTVCIWCSRVLSRSSTQNHIKYTII